MKKIMLLSLTAMFFLISCKDKTSVGANGVRYKSPVEYNDYIVTKQAGVIKKVLNFSKVSQTNLDSAEAMLDGFIKDVDGLITDIKGMPPYKGDSSLRDASVSLFKFYKRTFDKEYRDIIHLRKEQDGTSVEIEDRIQALAKGVTEEEKELESKFKVAQKKFAESNNMRIRENELQKEIDKLKGN